MQLYTNAKETMQLYTNAEEIKKSGSRWRRSAVVGTAVTMTMEQDSGSVCLVKMVWQSVQAPWTSWLASEAGRCHLLVQPSVAGRGSHTLSADVGTNADEPRPMKTIFSVDLRRQQSTKYWLWHIQYETVNNVVLSRFLHTHTLMPIKALQVHEYPSSCIYEGRLINKLQNSVIMLVFQI